ncbi:LacI family DNA-binding transcriptional regulator [Cohnella sp. JJ-181]|uniref:LacI family DNA-binding transcriptional regulator n=1 Tax=Cohnella rhizoplanae TaxID=2974897 RepID=UPI0022FF9410|nr:LacI family DNA-binding transcriptional regulator [Cohnella sp. JJ-181]CAI6083819.1 Catabolite control protein A [Cohnella sp. JJ-181]
MTGKSKTPHTGKRTTSFDVARAAGVSRSLVSAVINGTPGIGVSSETREKVLQAIKDLNYQVDAQARAMKTGLSRCVAAFGDMTNPLFLQLLEGMQKACAERGHHVLISGQSADDEDRGAMLDLYRQRRIDGIVTLDDTGYESADWIARVREAGAPYVSVEGYAGTGGVTSVLVDYRRSIRDALDYMGGSAERYPIYLEAYHAEPGKNWAERDRLEAYEEWCGEKGLKPIVHRFGAYDEAWMDRFLGGLASERGRLPPLLINWSVSAVLIYRAAWRRGIRIGEELALMAGDNTNRSNACMTPTLGSVEIPYAEMGEEAVRLLLDPSARAGGTAADKHWLRAAIVPGDSAPRGSGG